MLKSLRVSRVLKMYTYSFASKNYSKFWGVWKDPYLGDLWRYCLLLDTENDKCFIFRVFAHTCFVDSNIWKILGCVTPNMPVLSSRFEKLDVVKDSIKVSKRIVLKIDFWRLLLLFGSLLEWERLRKWIDANLFSLPFQTTLYDL